MAIKIKWDGSYKADIDQAIKNINLFDGKINNPKVVKKALEETAELIYRDTKPKVPKDTAELLNSWKTEPATKNSIIAGFDLAYAMYQHQGRRADGTHIIRNRPAGGESFFLSKTVDQNLKKYQNYFFKMLKKFARI